MALVTCKECQSQVSDRAVSCPQCGNVFTRCPECANEVRPGTATCENCGYPLAQAFTASLSTSPLLAGNEQYFGATGAANTVLYAGFWRRLNAAVIDAIIVSVVVLTVDFILSLVVGARSTAFTTMSSGLSIGIGVAYYAGLESSSGQATLGKRALGIKVTDLYGNRISSRRAVGRYFAKLISTLTLLIGYLMAGFTEKKQALHDMMAGTLVVLSR